MKQVLRLRQTENKSSKLVKQDSKQIVFINNIFGSSYCNAIFWKKKKIKFPHVKQWAQDYWRASVALKEINHITFHNHYRYLQNISWISFDEIPLGEHDSIPQLSHFFINTFSHFYVCFKMENLSGHRKSIPVCKLLNLNTPLPTKESLLFQCQRVNAALLKKRIRVCSNIILICISYNK